MASGILLKLLASSLCLLPHPALARNPKQENSVTAPAPVITWHAAGAITVPFEYFRQHIYVTLSVNGKSGFIFMLDTGANRNILDLRASRRLGLQPQTLNAANDIGFGDGRIYVGPEENVDAEISSVPIAHVMSVMDLNRFEQHFHHPTDGMLGYPFLRKFVVKVDFARKLLTLLPADQYHYRGLGVELTLKPSENFVVLPVAVGNARYKPAHQIDVVVDTGSNVTLILYERFIRPLDLESSFQHTQPGQAYGLNGYYPVSRGSMALLQIGDAETRDLPVDYMRNDDQVGPERNLPGAIGNGILQSFQAIIFDVPQRRMIFEVKPPSWQPGVQRTETAEP